jgi:hypothetical protein
MNNQINELGEILAPLIEPTHFQLTDFANAIVKTVKMPRWSEDDKAAAIILIVAYMIASYDDHH